mmetsp:Transcript_32992/g.51454  ORF Transcript_32992/g.51454 Transcript_32992/m.51454 type:complete len:85 (+) Transcript_32992:564-818(+)
MHGPVSRMRLGGSHGQDLWIYPLTPRLSRGESLSVSLVLHGRELVVENLSDHNRNQRSTPPKPADNPSVLQQGDEASCWTASTE